MTAVKTLAHYTAPWWLPGGHLQTIWPALYSRRYAQAPAVWRRERWTTPDQDFVDVDFCETVCSDPAKQWVKPLLVLFHGLEGSSGSHYAQAFADWAQLHGCDIAVPHFRGCSGSLNLGPRAYHSGDHEEIHFLLARFKQQADAQKRPGIVAAGVSLGGNALMRWAGEQGQAAQLLVKAVASVCSPLDLMASGKAIGQGFNRQVYTRMFLRTMKPKAMAKLQQHPGLFDAKKLMAATDLYAFDNVFTAPLHGFQNTDDYWRRASALPVMSGIQVPALAVNAANDPFVPACSLPVRKKVSAYVELWQPSHGGHVGFAKGALPGHLKAMPEAVGEWLLQRLK
jgi:predicted alpha/beta-fold hydrolase